MSQSVVLSVAVPAPLYQYFDYLPPVDVTTAELTPGIRLEVPFGRRQCVGVLLAVHKGSDFRGQLKRATRVLDSEPVLDDNMRQLLDWAASYYHHPPGEVYSTALPASLRRSRPPRQHTLDVWQLTQSGRQASVDELKRSPRQREILIALQKLPDEPDSGLDRQQLQQLGGDWRNALKKLVARGWACQRSRPSARDTEALPIEASAATQAVTLNSHQQIAVQSLLDDLERFQVSLLYGVTGSGKTEVYLQAIASVLQRGRQALVLVPEIGLTPQLVTRFRQRFGAVVDVMHSGLNDGERYRAWQRAASGQARIIIGTRSAVFTPLPEPGIIVVDEEHDSSLKQMEGLRYSARDVAIMRARLSSIPIVLGSATPALESYHNANRGRYRLLHLPARAGGAMHPTMQLLDVRGQPMDEGISWPLMQSIQQHLQRGGQVLLFLNRRGYAPTLLCHDCGWVAQCRRCDAHMTIHQRAERLRCHHCGAEAALPKKCPGCLSNELRPVGQGTERTETALQQHFPEQRILRIDRDTTQRRGQMDALLEQAERGEADILIGTQLLAKGHHFPGVTLVGILNSDQGLFSVDFRAPERMAQQVLQVAGRAGRADKPGEVIIQTHSPDHPLLHSLTRQDYDRIARTLLQERELVELPPYSYIALLRAEATDAQHPQTFLHQAAGKITASTNNVETLGPVPAPMERRAGRYRYQLLIQCAERGRLHHALATVIPQLGTLNAAKRVRWSVDVDPVDSY